MIQVTGIDHIYITVSDMARSEVFYDKLLRDVLGFRKGGNFALGGDPHLNYYNRLFGFVLRPARVATPHQPARMRRACITSASGSSRRTRCMKLRAS